MSRLPLTTIAGYLGAGKTTLINRLLAEPHGARLMVLVNDFGAINIDAELLESADEDTLTLSNGCVCCTIGGDLFMAIGDALDRVPRPDHLIIEASGVAQPAKIANAALAEPDLLYGGVVTLVDALEYRRLAADPLVGDQVKDQVRAADLVLVTKAQDAGLALELGALARAPVMEASEDVVISDMLLGLAPESGPEANPAPHPAYTSWSAEEPRVFTREALLEKIAGRPEGLYRMKGRLAAKDGGLELHVVGGQVSVTECQTPARPSLVAIGPKAAVSPEAIVAWWDS